MDQQTRHAFERKHAQDYMKAVTDSECRHDADPVSDPFWVSLLVLVLTVGCLIGVGIVIGYVLWGSP